MQDQNCIFCKIINGTIPAKILYQTDHAIVISDISPQAPIHYLIIPKVHVQDLVACNDPVILADLFSIPAVLAAQLGSQAAFKLFTNNGYAAGQRVFHLHIHFLSGKQFAD